MNGQRILGLFSNDANNSTIGTNVADRVWFGGWGDSGNLGGGSQPQFGLWTTGLNAGLYRFSTDSNGVGASLTWGTYGPGLTTTQFANQNGMAFNQNVNMRCHYNVSSLTDLIYAFNDTLNGSGESQKVIFINLQVTVNSQIALTAHVGNIRIYGQPIVFATTSSKLNFDNSATASMQFYNDIIIAANCTPFAFGSLSNLSFRNVINSGSAHTVTFPTSNCIYEKLGGSLSAVNGTNGYWDNTFSSAAGNFIKANGFTQITNGTSFGTGVDWAHTNQGISFDNGSEFGTQIRGNTSIGSTVENALTLDRDDYVNTDYVAQVFRMRNLSGSNIDYATIKGGINNATVGSESGTLSAYVKYSSGVGGIKQLFIGSPFAFSFTPPIQTFDNSSAENNPNAGAIHCPNVGIGNGFITVLYDLQANRYLKSLKPQVCSLKMTASSKNIPYNTDTSYDFTIDSDIDNMYDTGNGRIIIKNAGVYKISLCVLWEIGSGASQKNIQFKVNGSSRARAQSQVNNSIPDSMFLERTMTLAANDYVEFTAYTSSSTGQFVTDVGTYASVTRCF